MIFAAYFILRGHDTHFLRFLLFLVGMICPLMQEHFTEHPQNHAISRVKLLETATGAPQNDDVKKRRPQKGL